MNYDKLRKDIIACMGEHNKPHKELLVDATITMVKTLQDANIPPGDIASHMVLSASSVVCAGEPYEELYYLGEFMIKIGELSMKVTKVKDDIVNDIPEDPNQPAHII